MTARQINLVLWTMAGALGVAAVATLVAGLAMPLSAADVESSAKVRSATTRPDASQHGLDAKALEPIVSTKWRRPLSDAPAPATAPVAAAPAAANETLPVKLVGTVGKSLAMLQDSSGNIQLTSVGESASGVKVLAVRPAQADVEFNGRKMTLKTEKQPGEP